MSTKSGVPNDELVARFSVSCIPGSAKASGRTTSRKVETERAKSKKCMRDLSQHQFNEQRFLILWCAIFLVEAGSRSRAPEFLRIEIGILRHANERRLRFGRRADTPIGFLVDVEPDETFDKRKAGAESGNDSVDPLALVAARLSRRHFSNHDRLFLGRKEGIDVLENLLEALPAAVCRSPVVPIDPGPIDIGIARIIIHRIFVTSVDVRDVWTPRPDHIGSSCSNEEVVNVSISSDVQGRVVATPSLVAIHLGGEIEEELFPEGFRAVRAC